MSGRLEERPYGRAGDTVSAIGLGGSYLDKRSLDTGVATVRRALELGITYFDTAPAYGRGASQLIMGRALEGRTERHLLATKLGYLSRPEHWRSPEALRAQLGENLRALRRGSVDTLQLHLAELACWWRDDARPDARIEVGAEPGAGSPAMPDPAAAPALAVLREARERGLCRYLGVTADSAPELAWLVDRLDVDVCLLAYEYSLLSRRGRRLVLPAARRRLVTYVAAGIIVPTPPDLDEADLAAMPGLGAVERERRQRLYRLAHESGLSTVDLAIRFLLADPGIATILVGASAPDEIEACVAAAVAGPLPGDLHRAVEALDDPAGMDVS